MEITQLLNLKNISIFQKLSKSFTREFRRKLRLDLMLQKNKITHKFYKELLKPKKINRFELMIFDNE